MRFLDRKGFLVKDRGSSQTFVSFDELYINLQIISLFRLALIFKEIRLKKPFINLVAIRTNPIIFLTS